MIGSDNVCDVNENKGLSGFDTVISSTVLQDPPVGESTEPAGFARNCRACAVPFNTFDGRRRFCSDECRKTAFDASLRRRQSKHRLVAPDANRARQILKNAVNRGLIRRCTRCESCGAAGQTSGHHSDYSRPLFVTWLCLSCHAGLEGGQHFGCGESKHALQSSPTHPQQPQRHIHRSHLLNHAEQSAALRVVRTPNSLAPQGNCGDR
jgi:hypothetical protein